MKIKILVCDYFGNALQFIAKNFLKDGYEIIGVITPKSTENIHLIKDKQWDYLVIWAPVSLNAHFKKITQVTNIPETQVVYLINPDSIGTHPNFVYSVINLGTVFGKEAINACNLYCSRWGGGKSLYNMYDERKFIIPGNLK